MSESLFWICLGAVLYTYFAYPLLLLLLYSATQITRDLRYVLARRERRVRNGADLPDVSIIIPVHNERRRLAAKLANLAALDYPAGKLEVVFASDGSTDGSYEYLREHARANHRVLAVPERKGKANALNHAVAAARGEVLLFCDANTLIPPDGVRKLARHFLDESVGMACAALRLSGSEESERTEGVYWRYESMLRLMEARLGATLVATGPLYAMRRSCYRPLAVQTLSDDLITALQVRQAGLRVLYDPEVLGVDQAADTVEGEFKRRVRLAQGSFRAFPEIFRAARSPWFSFAFFSHKILRWILPVPLLGMFAANLMLDAPLYRAALAAQILFYLLAAMAYFRRGWLPNAPGVLLPYFLVSIHAAFVVGFFKLFDVKPRDGTWERLT